MKAIWLVMLLLVVPSSALMAQDNGMLPAAGTDEVRGQFTAEILPTNSEHGAQTWVQKYQKFDDKVWSLSSLDVFGYTGPWQYFVNGLDVATSNNTYLDLDVGYADRAWLKAYTTYVTRRIPRWPLNGAPVQYDASNPTKLAAQFFNEEFPGETPAEFDINRNESAARLTLPVFGGKRAELSLFGDLWSENEKGTKPLVYRTRVESPTRKFETTEPVDQNTTDPGIGAELGVGPGALTYRHSTTKYTNNVTGPLLRDTHATELIAPSAFANNSTRNDVWKMSMPLGSKLALTGAWIKRNQVNRTAGIIGSDATDLTDVTLKNTSGALNLSYAAVSNLLVVARYRTLDTDRNSSELGSNSKNEKEGELEATFTGLPSTMFRSSYSLRRITGSLIEPAETEAEGSIPAAHYKTFKVGATNYSVHGLNLRGDWKHQTVDHPEFHAVPNKTDDMKAGLTWSGAGDLVVYADLGRLHEKNSKVPAPTAVLTIADFASATAYTEYRELISGAQYDNKIDDVNIGLYKSLATKLTLDANYLMDRIRSREVWVLGSDTSRGGNIGGEGDTTENPAPPERVPYRATDKVWQAGLTYAFRPKLSLRGNVLSGKTDGVTNSNSLFNFVNGNRDTTVAWQPINAKYWKYSVGVTYRWTPGQQLLVEVSRNTWDDRVYPEFNGAYTSLSLALQTKF